MSLYSGANIDQAVDRLQFDYAIDEEPTGIMFGAEGYAGVQMNQELDGLRQEYILFQNGEDIFLIELAKSLPGMKGRKSLLQVMLDTFTVLRGKPSNWGILLIRNAWGGSACQRKGAAMDYDQLLDGCGEGRCQMLGGGAEILPGGGHGTPDVGCLWGCGGDVFAIPNCLIVSLHG